MNDNNNATAAKHYLLASDFDQTLSFNDSGVALSEMLGVHQFEEKIAGLSKISLVQQGAELAYLLRHDPQFRRVRREHLIATGKRIRLKNNVREFAQFLDTGVEGYRFSFYVISAAPREVVESALEGIVPADHIIGTEFGYDPVTGEISSIQRTSAGYGKVLALHELQSHLQTRPDHTIYVGDGSSDIYVMQHVNNSEGFTIAVSEARFLTRIAKRTVLSDNACSVLVPILEDLLHWTSPRIRELFGSYGLSVQEWDKFRTDRLTFLDSAPDAKGIAIVAA
jgi:phosphoserine phosphatase